MGKTKPFGVVNSERLGKRNAPEGAEAVFCDGVEDTMPGHTRFHRTSQLSLEIRIEIEELLPLGWDALLP